MKISILTPTYNRAKMLPELYESLKENIKYNIDFEWLIMDDGSTDNTKEIVANFISEHKVNIKYYYQENKGKMIAINNLVEYATGDLIIDCDSDDYFAKNAFGTIMEHADKLMRDDELYALIFLKCDISGEISGEAFKKDDYKTTMFDLYFKDDVKGEKIILFKSAIRKQFKHKVEENEKFVTEARMYHEMDRQYKVLCINTPIVIGAYQNDGYTKNINKIFIENPKGYMKYFKEILQNNTRDILYIIKHYILFSYLTKNKKILEGIKGRLNRFLIALLYIPGCVKTKLKIKTKAPKVLISSWTLEVGGIETALVNLVNGLSEKYNVTLALEKKQGVFLDRLNPHVEVIEYLPNTDKNPFIRKIKNMLKRMKFTLKHKNKYDLSICFATYSRPASFMARTASKNSVLWIHTNYMIVYKNNKTEIIEFFNKVKYNKFKKIVCISQDAKNAFENVFTNFNKEIEIINNLVDYKTILQKAEEKIDLEKNNITTFLSVCRHEEEAKKLTRLIEATEIIKKQGLQCRVLFVGEGEATNMYKELVKEKELEDYIVFCGMHENPYPYFKISDCVILTSEYEGYPVVYVEAKVLNKPIITTAVSDSLIDIEGKYGMVTDKNTQDIAKTMIEFIKNGYKIKETFKPEEFNKNVLRKIEKLL